MSLVVNIDFGGVLSIHDRNTESKNTEHVSTIINMPGGVEALKELKRKGHKLYLNSFCGKKRALETKNAIMKEKELNGIFENLYFVKDKANKGYVCLHTGCNVMIDDRVDVLTSVQKTSPTVHCILFKGDPTHSSSSSNFIECDSWESVVKVIDKLPVTKMGESNVNMNKYVYNV